MKNLSPKQERFCLEHVKDGNGTQAAIRAGYSEKSARYMASTLLTKPNIQARLKELHNEIAEGCKVTVQNIIDELDSIGFSDLAEIYNKDGTPKKIHDIPPRVRRWIKSIRTKRVIEKKGKKSRPVIIEEYQLWDKIQASALSGRFRGSFKEKVEVTGANGEAVPIRIVNIKPSEKKEPK